MGRIIKWLLSITAALVGGAIGEILSAQRDEHPSGALTIAPSPTQLAPCIIVIALAARQSRGNLLIMVGGGLLAGVISGLGFGTAKK